MNNIFRILNLTLIISFFAVPLSAEKKYPNTENGARELVNQFLKKNADKKKLTFELQPTDEDYKTFFGDKAKKAKKGYRSLWNGKNIIGPKPGQTNFLLFKATTKEIKNWEGNAKSYFPGGYQQIASSLPDNYTIYVFKFVKPNTSMGMSFDGLVYINGHWVIFPKPWRVLK